MTEHHRTLLDDLDRTSVGNAPVEELLSRGRAAKRRQRRGLVAGAAVVTALMVGGGAVATQGVPGSSGDGDSNNPVVADPALRNLTVRVEVGVPAPLASILDGQRGEVALWNPANRVLAFVPDMGYSSSCPPQGTAATTASGAVTLTLRDDPTPGICTADDRFVTVTIEGITTAPSALTVTADGDTTTVPVEPVDGEASPDDQTRSGVDVTRCSDVRLPQGGIGEADFNVDPAQGLLTINFSDVREGTYRNISYTVRYRADPTCDTTPAMSELIERVVPDRS